MFRRLHIKTRQAIKKWLVLLLSAAMLTGSFAAVPYIASALPEFPARNIGRSDGTEQAVPAFALSGDGRDGGNDDGQAVGGESGDSAESGEENVEEPIPAPTPGEDDLPVFARNLCWYDDPSDAVLNIINRTKFTITLDKYAAESFPLSGKITNEPLVLIIHTHGSESYLQPGYEFYSADETFRSTEDESATVVHIGDVLCQRLEELGIPAVHDRFMYDTIDFNKSYNYSREGIIKALEQYPSIKFVIDLHRDSIFSSSGQNIKPVTEIDGKQCAQLMIVVGTNEGGADHPNWRRNLVVATHLQVTMNEFFPTLARPINVRSSAFNQALTDGSILVECGSCGNTVEEAENAILCFAEAYAYMLKTEFEN